MNCTFFSIGNVKYHISLSLSWADFVLYTIYPRLPHSNHPTAFHLWFPTWHVCIGVCGIATGELLGHPSAQCEIHIQVAVSTVRICSLKNY